MTEEEIKNKLMERFLQAQTPWGRWRLAVYVKWKRLSWAAVVNSTLFLKRAFDVVVSLITLILLSPLLVLIAIIIKLDGGPAVFKQERIGLNGRLFTMYKFRSMIMGAEEKLKDLLPLNEKPEGVTFKIKGDPRVTRIGAFLRRTSMDELPQFFNVLLGDMSLVGPRPPVPREVALYTLNDRRRLSVKPGITCLWQVGERHGGMFEIGDRNAIDFREQVGLDVSYIENQSFWGDIRILLKTIPAVFFGKGM